MSKFSYDLFVIGAGSGGVRASRMAASLGAKVAVAEHSYLGGTCVNVGCVPKKLFSYAAHVHDELLDAKGFGWQIKNPSWQWQTLLENKNKEIERLNKVYHKLLTNSGAKIISGQAKLIDEHTVEVNDELFSAKNILIATGGYPVAPKFPGYEHTITSTQAFYLKNFPKRVAVIGGGYIGVEFASIFNGLGSDTKLLMRRELPLRGFDESIRIFLNQEMIKKGLDITPNVNVQVIEKKQEELIVTLNNGEVFTTDCVLAATGRKSNTGDLGLEKLGVRLNNQGAIIVDQYYQSNIASIYAIGDVIDKIKLTPVAIREAMAVVQTLFHNNPSSVDYTNIPTAVFSHPNIGTVGLTEEQARAKYSAIEVFATDFRPLKHTVSGSDERCMMKMIVDKSTDKVLGVHIVGFEAGELIQGVAVALKSGATKADFDNTIGVHPTSAEELVTLN